MEPRKNSQQSQKANDRQSDPAEIEEDSDMTEPIAHQGGVEQELMAEHDQECGWSEDGSHCSPGCLVEEAFSRQQLSLPSLTKMNSQGFIIQKLEYIKQLQMQKVEMIEDFTALSSDKAILLLRHYKWNEEKLQIEWYGAESYVKKLRILIGLDFDPEILKQHPNVNTALCSVNGGICQICYSEFD